MGMPSEAPMDEYHKMTGEPCSCNGTPLREVYKDLPDKPDPNGADIIFEVVKDQKGNILKHREYKFSKRHGKGETFIEDGVTFTVVSHDIKYWRRIGILECVVR